MNGCNNRSLGLNTSTTNMLTCDTALDFSTQASSAIQTLVDPILSEKTAANWNSINFTNTNIILINIAIMILKAITTL